MTSLKDKKIIIVAHFLLYGAAQALTDYLNNKKINKLLYIALPLVTQRQEFVLRYEKGSQVSKKISDRENVITVIDYLIDFFSVVLSVWKQGFYDIYVGFDALNCLSGLFLRKIGKVNKVIFYSIDFVPIRFSNKILNTIYHKIEIFCVQHADECWNVSPRIAQGREDFFHVSQSKYLQKVVPIGIWNKDIKKREFKEINKHQLLFIGHLLEKQGVQIVLEAIPIIVKKIPDFTFIIVGGGEYEEQLKHIVNNLNITKYVTFTGWIKDRKKIDEMMSKSAIAIASYKPEKEKLHNFTYYADPTKLKDYLGAGLPIVLTDISYNAQEISKKKCGVLIEYNKNAIAKAIISLLSDIKQLQLYRKNALQYAKEFDWQEIFDKAYDE